MSDQFLAVHPKASRSDVLEWLGWKKCDDCHGTGDKAEIRGPMGYEGLMPVECNPRCLSGLVPPASQVEAVKNAIARTFIEQMGWGESKPWEALEVYAMAEIQARAALIAAMEGVGE